MAPRAANCRFMCTCRIQRHEMLFGLPLESGVHRCMAGAQPIRRRSWLAGVGSGIALAWASPGWVAAKLTGETLQYDYVSSGVVKGIADDRADARRFASGTFRVHRPRARAQGPQHYRRGRHGTDFRPPHHRLQLSEGNGQRAIRRARRQGNVDQCGRTRDALQHAATLLPQHGRHARGRRGYGPRSNACFQRNAAALAQWFDAGFEGQDAHRFGRRNERTRHDVRSDGSGFLAVTALARRQRRALHVGKHVGRGHPHRLERCASRTVRRAERAHGRARAEDRAHAAATLGHGDCDNRRNALRLAGRRGRAELDGRHFRREDRRRRRP